MLHVLHFMQWIKLELLHVTLYLVLCGVLVTWLFNLTEVSSILQYLQFLVLQILLFFWLLSGFVVSIFSL